MNKLSCVCSVCKLSVSDVDELIDHCNKEHKDIVSKVSNKETMSYDVRDVEVYGLKEEIGKLVARNKLLVEKYNELCSCISSVTEQLNKILDKQGDEYGYS